MTAATRNEAAERLRHRAYGSDGLGEAERQSDIDAALTAAQAEGAREAVERMQREVNAFVAAFPTGNRTALYQRALALQERIAQWGESLDEEAAR